jgi:TRAP-type C4-dicarboxylate transport system substrate-binding protein
MRRTREQTRRATFATAALLAVAAAAGCASGDKAGGSGGPVTLRIGTDDPAGRPSGTAMDEFARQARRLSGGRIRIEPVFQAGGTTSAPGWDQRIAHMVQAGRLDMGVVPARAWDTEGVTSLRALHAPFLVTSDTLLNRIVRGDVADQMLAGLDRAGIVGLALLPEELRHPFAFGQPFLKVEDFAGQVVRVPRSDVAYSTFRHLGARPEDLAGPRFMRAVANGSVRGADAGFAIVSGSLPRSATATANVTLFPKANTLVIGQRAWKKLDDANRAVLREAARRTVASVVSTRVGERDAARRYCAAGGRVVLADKPDIAAMVEATSPVYAVLERDAQTRGLIARIRALKRSLPPDADVAGACDAARTVAAAGAVGDAHVVDGVWRSNPTYEEGLAAGLPKSVAAEEMGLETIRMERGRYDWRWRARIGDKRCAGRYQVSGNVVFFTDDEPCTGSWEAAFRRSGRTLRWSRVRTHTSDPHEQTIAEMILHKPWTLIQPVHTPTRAFPDGIYRADIPARFLIGRGVPAATAATNSGLMTLTFDRGRWRHHTKAPNIDDCTGRYSVKGTRVSVIADGIEACGTAAGEEIFSATWTLSGAELRLTDARGGDGDDVFARAFWGGKPWRKIG